jgi:Flp pilus assembly pilin Flp
MGGTRGDIMFHFITAEEGQGLLEYALVLVLIAVVVAVILLLFGEGLAGYYEGGIGDILRAIGDVLWP